jgi:molybdenum cofactor biosynthesis enzyme MoaA
MSTAESALSFVLNIDNTVRLVHQKRQKVPIRVITNGLQKLEVPAALRSGGVQKVSVALMSHDPEQYAQIMQPSNGLTHSDVCSFVEALCAAGIDTECTSVRQPGVDVEKAQDLARSLGAQSFRAREYFM